MPYKIKETGTGKRKNFRLKIEVLVLKNATIHRSGFTRQAERVAILVAVLTSPRFMEGIRKKILTPVASQESAEEI